MNCLEIPRSPVVLCLCLAMGLVLLGPAADRAHGVFVIADFDTPGALGTSNPFGFVGDGTRTVGDFIGSKPGNEIEVVTPGGFQNMLVLDVARNGPLHQLLMDNLLFGYTAYVDPSQGPIQQGPNTFLNNFIVANTNVQGHGYQIFGNTGGQLSAPLYGGATTQQVEYSLAPIKGLLEDYAAGDGTFFQVFLVQQTDADIPITVVYDDFYITPEPGRALLLALAAIGLMWRRSRAGARVAAAAGPRRGCAARAGCPDAPRGS